MPFGGLIVNRVHAVRHRAAADEDELARELGDAKLAAKVMKTWDEARVLAGRDQASLKRLKAETGDSDPVLVPLLEGDVHDVDGLVASPRPPLRVSAADGRRPPAGRCRDGRTGRRAAARADVRRARRQRSTSAPSGARPATTARSSDTAWAARSASA